MKFLVLALCVCAASAAVPSYVSSAAKAVVSKPSQVQNTGDVEASILRSDSEINENGFNYVYETGNGISQQVTGHVKKVDNVDVVAVEGSYRYTAPDGTPVVFNYVADENGYQPQSDLIPVAPPVPVAIARALEYIAAHPPAPETVAVGGGRKKF